MDIGTIIVIIWAVLQLTTLILERFRVIHWRSFWIWSPTVFILVPFLGYLVAVFIAFLVAYG